MSTESKQKLVTYEDLGYMVPPPKKTWPDKGKGIRCGNCVWFKQHSAKDMEDMLGGCALLPRTEKVHEQACCNYQWNAQDKVNPMFASFPGSDALRAKLPFYGK
jgi:hypothetical protein